MKKQEEVTPEIPSTISINGVDYDPTEAQSLIELGTKTRDLEKQYDTPLDNVWTGYGKTREDLKTIQAERDAARQEIEAFKQKQAAGVETPKDIQEAKKAARELGLVLNEDFEKAGYIKKDDLPKYFNEYSNQQKEVNKIIDTANKLESEINGSDGRPAFNKKVVLAYAQAYEMADLKEAYEDMHKTQLDAWKKTQIESKRTPGLKTMGAGGQKNPDKVKITDDNVKDLLKEALHRTE